jgi:hypothetical protein
MRLIAVVTATIGADSGRGGLAIWAIVCGCIAIVVAFVGNKFYSADIAGGSISDKPIPNWVGRAGFIVVGVLLIIGGIASLLFNH